MRNGPACRYKREERLHMLLYKGVLQQQIILLFVFPWRSRKTFVNIWPPVSTKTKQVPGGAAKKKQRVSFNCIPSGDVSSDESAGSFGETLDSFWGQMSLLFPLYINVYIYMNVYIRWPFIKLNFVRCTCILLTILLFNLIFSTHSNVFISCCSKDLHKEMSFLHEMMQQRDYFHLKQGERSAWRVSSWRILPFAIWIL